MENEFKLGDVVKVTAGKGKGECFIVIGVLDNYCKLADGNYRRIEHYKLKKNKHMKPGFGHSSFIHEKMINGTMPTNKELRRELSNIIESDLSKKV